MNKPSSWRNPEEKLEKSLPKSLKGVDSAWEDEGIATQSQNQKEPRLFLTTWNHQLMISDPFHLQDSSFCQQAAHNFQLPHATSFQTQMDELRFRVAIHSHRGNWPHTSDSSGHLSVQYRCIWMCHRRRSAQNPVRPVISDVTKQFPASSDLKDHTVWRDPVLNPTASQVHCTLQRSFPVDGSHPTSPTSKQKCGPMPAIRRWPSRLWGALNPALHTRFWRTSLAPVCKEEFGCLPIQTGLVSTLDSQTSLFNEMLSPEWNSIGLISTGWTFFTKRQFTFKSLNTFAHV